MNVSGQPYCGLTWGVASLGKAADEGLFLRPRGTCSVVIEGLVLVWDSLLIGPWFFSIAVVVVVGVHGPLLRSAGREIRAKRRMNRETEEESLDRCWNPVTTMEVQLFVRFPAVLFAFSGRSRDTRSSFQKWRPTWPVRESLGRSSILSRWIHLDEQSLGGRIDLPLRAADEPTCSFLET